MANENGHIYAPVGVHEVASVLGEGSLDVATLCMSGKINPYSLIRPVPTEVPTFEVASMKDANLGELLPSTTQYGWEKKQWNYQVPYVSNPSNIDLIKDFAWYRPTPEYKHYKCLNHFDGYLHDVEPMFAWSVGSPRQGEEIVVLLGFGLPQEDIVSANGRNNNGGVVSVLEVFGDEEFYYGIRVKYGTNEHIVYSEEKVIPGKTAAGTINTGLIARAGMTYYITPFICNMPRLANGAKFYNLKFAPEFEDTKEVTIDTNTVSIGIRALSTDATGAITSWLLVIYNSYWFAYETNLLKIKITETTTSNQTKVSETYLSPENAIGASAFRVEANSTASYTINQPIYWPQGASKSKYASIVVECTMTGAAGLAQTLTSNIMIMTNPNFITM